MQQVVFFNPNSSKNITQVFAKEIGRFINKDISYTVMKNTGAAPVISSVADNEQAIQHLIDKLDDLAAKFEHIVLMSSLDSGYECLQRLRRFKVSGFTRSVLGHYQRQNQKLNFVFFSQSMVAEYLKLLSHTQASSLLSGYQVIDLPADQVAKQPNIVALQAKQICQNFAWQNNHQVFIVGAVGIELSRQLQAEGYRVINPIEAMLKYLKLC